MTALILELLGVTLTQVARIYMGRSFGILPANRGIVSNGPFRWVRHPIYLGWLVLSIGYAMFYVNDRNVILIAVDASLHDLANLQEESASERGSRVPPLHGSRPLPSGARHHLSAQLDPVGGDSALIVRVGLAAARAHQVDSAGQRRRKNIANASPPITAIASGC